MANIKTTEKLYLDQVGLKALIDKIGEFYDEYKKYTGENDSNIEEIIARLDELYIADTGDGSASGLVKDLQDLVAGLRADLGNAADAAGDATAFARIAQLEAEVQAAGTGLLDRTSKLEAESFAKVEAAYDKEGKKVNVKFKNAAGEELGEGTSFDIDTTDFVIDGMIKNVHLVTIKDDGSVDWPDGDAHEIPAEYAQMHGKKFFVFCFNVSENVGTGEAVNVIWVPADELFNDYDFKAAGVDDYVKLAVEEVNPSTSNKVNEVTYTITLGQKAIDDFALVEGTYTEAEPSDPHHATPYRGIKDLNKGLEAAEADIDKLQQEVETPDTGLLDRTAQLEEEVQAAETGLLDRTAELENWVETKVIPVKNINDVFDYYVFNKTEGIVTPPSLPGMEDETAGGEGA